VYLEDRPGHEMIKAMRGEVIRRNIKTFENIMVTKLLTSDGEVVGATAIDTQTERFIFLGLKQ
jgi:fumarate reductase (CoM/CoB) subunit A